MQKVLDGMSEPTSRVVVVYGLAHFTPVARIGCQIVVAIGFACWAQDGGRKSNVCFS